MTNQNSTFKLRLKLAILCVLFFAIALSTKLNIFANNLFISGYLADFLAVIILIFGLKFALPKVSNLQATLTIFSLAFSIELFQLINSKIELIKVDNFLLQTIVGSKFDVLDLLVYTVASLAGFLSLRLLTVNKKD